MNVRIARSDDGNKSNAIRQRSEGIQNALQLPDTYLQVRWEAVTVIRSHDFAVRIRWFIFASEILFFVMLVLDIHLPMLLDKPKYPKDEEQRNDSHSIALKNFGKYDRQVP